MLAQKRSSFQDGSPNKNAVRLRSQDKITVVEPGDTVASNTNGESSNFPADRMEPTEVPVSENTQVSNHSGAINLSNEAGRILHQQTAAKMRTYFSLLASSSRLGLG